MSDAPRISKPILRFFRRIVRGYFRRHFHAVRISRAETFSGQTGPLIVYANHSSWWDPMVSVLLAAELMAHRDHFAPMDASSLDRYAILKRIGIFPVELNSARGGAQFLRTGLKILENGGVLWITPQGRFADTRERPLAFKAGMAALAARVPGGCTLLPLAIEYPFWNERLPEVLLRFGEPISVTSEDAAELQPLLEASLVGTMDDLRTLAMTRDAANFHTLNFGSAGVGGFYERGQRLRAWLQGKTYEAEHLSPTSHSKRSGVQE